MLRRLLSVGTVMFVGVAIVACDAGDSPTSTNELTPSFAKTTDDIPEKTTGDIYARGGAGNLNHFVFNAHMGSDSKNAKGRNEFEAVDVGWSASGEVTYVESIAPNSACFCGNLTDPGRATDWDGDGNAEFCVAVVDNGEPSTDDPVDYVEGAFEGLGSDRGEVDPFEGPGRCEFMRPASNAASSGNVQVHDNR